MRRGATHRFGSIPKTCRICSKPFLAKNRLAETCPDEKCQREAVNAAARARAARAAEGT